MQLHQLQPKTTRKVAKRIGRGGKRGKTSGRGMKGQKARAGNSTRPEMRDIIKKLPKLRGHGKNRAQAVNNERVRAIAVNLAVLERTFDAGADINPAALVAKGIIRETAKRTPQVKILATGEVTKKFTVRGCSVSAAAREKLVAQGGSVV